MEINQNLQRGCGVLLHISSLATKYSIGSLGENAYKFVDFLKKSVVKYWQVLPLVQTGHGDSPYQSACCNSGNPYFIDLPTLCEQNLITKSELKSEIYVSEKIDFSDLFIKRYKILRTAFSRFNVNDYEFKQFLALKKYDDYALFMAIKAKNNHKAFCFWQDEYKFKNFDAIEKFKIENQNEILFWQFLQFEFWKQWFKLKNYANENGIKIIGDIPLYVAYDSSDVWSQPNLFKVDENLKPIEVAGCPPDYFSKTGQLWGNPIYNWDEMKKDDYAWWINRLNDAECTYDYVRIDHFRGLDRYYSIKSDQKTAEIGEWKEGPKEELFSLAEKKLGKLNFIAEDLGVIDDGVIRLLNNTAFPNMKILLFAFDGNDSNSYLPKNINENSVCYTGTHDNDTVMGFLNSLTRKQFLEFKQRVIKTIKEENIELEIRTKKDICKAFLNISLKCNSILAVIPMQDILFLDNNSRMNTPSTASDNWQFKLEKMPNNKTSEFLHELIIKYNR